MIVKKKLIIGVISLFTIVGCKVTAPYQRPETEKHINLRDSMLIRDNVQKKEIVWKEIFSDPKLQRIINNALINNIDQKIAIKNIEIAKLFVRQSKMAYYPQLDVYASAKKAKLAYPQGFGFFTDVNQFDLGASASWEIDLLGKLKHAKKIEAVRLLRTIEGKRMIETNIVALAAEHYYQLASLDQSLKILEESRKLREKDVEVVKKLMAIGLTTSKDSDQSNALLREVDLLILDAKQKIRETENSLSLLTGGFPETIERSTLEQQNEISIFKESGIPISLLANRPDIREAELTFQEKFEQVNVSRTFFYPSLTLTAGGGFSSFQLKEFFNPISIFGNIAGGLTQPLLSKGKNKIRLQYSILEKEKAYDLYIFSLAKASQEVSDALYVFEQFGERKKIRKIQIDDLSRAKESSISLLVNNYNTNYTDVLLAERLLLESKLNATNDALQEWMSVVKLYRALGGSWNEQKTIK